ncbi:MAG: ABC-ATPase domain-containing protein [Spirochaetes bacterium]|nr:ABC-ATPase domain-containing protein [Spirochaetota bacterium]
MNTIEVLRRRIESINERDYGAYQSLKGDYRFPAFTLFIDQIPKDPYAPPHTGVYRVQLQNAFTGQFECIFNSKTGEIAFRDFLARNFHRAAASLSKGRRGTGNSGLITIERPGQVILERNSVIVTRGTIEIRFFMGLPANGRRINSPLCTTMMLQELPRMIETALLPENVDTGALEAHIETSEDAEHIRSMLGPLNLVAFIADGSILPRKSGTSDEPLDRAEATPFISPETLSVAVELPHAGRITGMGIPRGITLIVGGGYHGKSTLLNAIEMGIYNHVPGDGRERCVSDQGTAKIRAYSGRYIEKVDISMFIGNLPLQKDTVRFSTENASGSTSQAGSIVEAIEAGAGALLMDEDTCATNFMIRDRKMQLLVNKDDEPITTFIDRVRGLFTSRGISTILVLGGIGDYFEVSDIVIQMREYRPVDVTGAAREITGSSAEKRVSEGRAHDIGIQDRVPAPGCVNPHNEYNKRSVYATEINRIHFGRTAIDLTDVEQLIELSQVKAIAEAIQHIGKSMDGKKSLRELVDRLMSEIGTGGLDVLSSRAGGHFSMFRGIDLACALNRMRDLKIH